MRPLLTLSIATGMLAACAGSPTLTIAECPVGRGVEVTGPDAVPCAPLLDLQAETEGDFFRFWGTLSAFPRERTFEGGTVSVVETGRSVTVPASGRFSIDSLRAGQTLLISSEGYMDLRRNVSSLYREVRG